LRGCRSLPGHGPPYGRASGFLLLRLRQNGQQDSDDEIFLKAHRLGVASGSARTCVPYRRPNAQAGFLPKQSALLYETHQLQLYRLVPEGSRPDFAISTEGKWSPVTRAHSSLSALSLPIKRESLRRDLPPISTLCKFFIVIYLSSVPTLSIYSPLSSSPPSSLFVGFFLVYYLSRRGLIEANFVVVSITVASTLPVFR
jgi:hypothetical protein